MWIYVIKRSPTKLLWYFLCIFLPLLCDRVETKRSALLSVEAGSIESWRTNSLRTFPTKIRIFQVTVRWRFSPHCFVLIVRMRWSGQVSSRSTLKDNSSNKHSLSERPRKTVVSMRWQRRRGVLLREKSESKECVKFCCDSLKVTTIKSWLNLPL